MQASVQGTPQNIRQGKPNNLPTIEYAANRTRILRALTITTIIAMATTFPTNRIVVYAQPPVDVSSLRNYSDWMTLVVTHELTHVFHLDRTRGFFSALQHVFGRNPYTFPAAYEPRWGTGAVAYALKKCAQMELSFWMWHRVFVGWKRL